MIELTLVVYQKIGALGTGPQGEFALPVKFSEIKRLNRILDLPA